MRIRTASFVILLVIAGPFAGFCCGATGAGQSEGAVQAPIRWRTPARLRHRLTAWRGTIEIGGQGVVFRADKGQSLSWSFISIQSFYVTRHKLEIRGYANRGWRLPGEKVYRFDLSRAVPPDVAATLAARVGKPSQNGDPDSGLPAFTSIPARHPTRTGGSNGVLRFNRKSIDYVTPSGRDSRSWRWADIQTLVHPAAYQFTVGGYRETYRFKLKQPMSQALFDRLWDAVYGRGLQLSTGREGK
ncbi:MAG: hypothetical protein ACRD2P_02480 [Terriglobia bacterium]